MFANLLPTAMFPVLLPLSGKACKGYREAIRIARLGILQCHADVFKHHIYEAAEASGGGALTGAYKRGTSFNDFVLHVSC